MDSRPDFRIAILIIIMDDMLMMIMKRMLMMMTAGGGKEGSADKRRGSPGQKEECRFLLSSLSQRRGREIEIYSSTKGLSIDLLTSPLIGLLNLM